MALIRKAGTTTPAVLPYSAPRGLTAAAQVVNIKDIRALEAFRKRTMTITWSAEAWEYFDTIGEIGYAFSLFSDVVSRIRIHAAYVNDDESSPVRISQSDASEEAKKSAQRAMNRVFGIGQQSEIMRAAALNLLVAGEFYLVNVPADILAGTKERWVVVASNELKYEKGKGYSIKTSELQSKTEELHVPDGKFAARIWNRHPRYMDDAISSMKAVLDECDTLMLLNQAVKATARSRLNAGMLFIPDTLAVAGAVDTDPTVDIEADLAEYIEEEADDVEDELLEAMTTPITDPSSAAAVVPLILRGPESAGAAIKLIKFERSFDPQLVLRMERSLERILQGINLPKEIASGLSQLKYSSSQVVQESLYTQHVEPMILMLCDAFRTVWLEPAMIKDGIDQDEIDKIVIWYDPSRVMTAPDRSNAANVGFNNRALSWKAWRESNGFSDDDAPDEKELAIRLALDRGQINDAVMEQLLATIMPEILKKTREAEIANSPAPLPGEVQDLLDGTESPPDVEAETPAPADAPAPPPDGTVPPAAGPPPGAVS